ncbi:axial regulator YABBY 4 [Impatiens glandulifera]|uniref:axial regulator YABBY 4 n=1 Tax=Impatiens glandulifera TaxID=253017 RepID=UPI001FB1550D|nr:axial regulator YABBY 4 [Impatiens glandulifera]
MSALSHLFDLHQEQLCYVQCGYCTTILLVSVPCNSLSMVVTVRCGHCTSLLSVNMTKATFLPLHLLASLNPDEPKFAASPPVLLKEGAYDHHQNPMEKKSPSLVISSDDDDDDLIPLNHVVNKPPEKRQRAPSAYNNFIKEEIRRLKGRYPSMSHKEAFSAAAKNWAQFPPIDQYKRDGESCSSQGVEREIPRCSEDAHEEQLVTNTVAQSFDVPVIEEMEERNLEAAMEELEERKPRRSDEELKGRNDNNK